MLERLSAPVAALVNMKVNENSMPSMDTGPATVFAGGNGDLSTIQGNFYDEGVASCAKFN